MKRPEIPAPPHRGGCLCGALRYALSARPKAINACHCLDCKKLTGATHLLMLAADAGAFSHEGPAAKFRKRADSGREVDIVRCAQCGVRLWHEPLSSPELVFIAAGTLDDWSWAVPTSHIWTRSLSPGLTVPEDVPQWEAQPETRQMLFDAFDRIYGAP